MVSELRHSLHSPNSALWLLLLSENLLSFYTNQLTFTSPHRGQKKNENRESRHTSLRKNDDFYEHEANLSEKKFILIYS